MKSSNLNNQNTKKQCLITFNWLILLTIIVSVAINGCVPTMNTNGKISKKQFQLSNVNRSKSKKERNINKQDLVETDKYRDLSADEQANDILEFERQISSSSYSKKSNKNKKDISEKDKYEILKQKQEIMEEEFNEGIANVKGELLEIKRMLSDVAGDKIQPSAARINYNDSQVKQENNIKTESATIKSAEENLLDKTFIIQSEEVANSKEQTINKKTKKVNVPKKNKNFKVVKNIVPEQKESKIEKSQPITLSTNSAENNFSDVISKLAKGDYNSASKIVNEKLNRTKDPIVVSNCNYWLGEISFNQRDYAKSIAYFNTALNNNCDKKDIAQARIAESYMRVGKNDEAKIAYKNLLKDYPKSTHSPKAKKMLQQL